MLTFYLYFGLFIYFVHGNSEDANNMKQRDYEYDPGYWKKNAYKNLIEKRNYITNNNKAKNVILFLGDGMSFSTIAATRSAQGDEASSLSFEHFPVTGLSKTYCTDSKVADSACSSTAYLGGVKGNLYTVGVTADVKLYDCEAMRNGSNHVSSIAKRFQNEGLSSGVVTTTRVTHASPSGLYAHSACRLWENDATVAAAGLDPKKCHDIADQLINSETGKNIKVIMGGGARNFLPEKEGGLRKDGRNLIRAWQLDKMKRNKTHAYVSDKNQLRKVMSQKDLPEYLLGLFSMDHLSYHSEKNPNEPTLSEMTTAAITLLSKNNKGYFLMVEGGKIDMAHHENKANKAIIETKEFSKAIEKAKLVTSEEDTLMIVTADHSHAMLYSGYTKRDSSISGYAGKDSNGKSYRAISYSLGPGFRTNHEQDELEEDADDPDYLYEALRPADMGPHDGSDVAVFCSGPQAHMCSGSNEQSYYAHLMAYAACVGKGPKMCDTCGPNFCENCGHKLPPNCGPKTCSNCGHKIP